MTILVIPRNPLVDAGSHANTLEGAAAVSRLLSEIDPEQLSPTARAGLCVVAAMVSDALDHARHGVDRTVPAVSSG